MSERKELAELLARMDAVLHEADFVFCSIAEEPASIAEVQPLGMFREAEGMTVIVEKRTADALGWPYESTWRMITLTVHSDLEAVGFLAAVATALASAGVPANVVAGFYHDHLFVPTAKAHLALQALGRLSEEKPREELQ